MYISLSKIWEPRSYWWKRQSCPSNHPPPPPEVHLVCHCDAFISVSRSHPILLFFLVCFSGPGGKQILG